MFWNAVLVCYTLNGKHIICHECNELIFKEGVVN